MLMKIVVKAYVTFNPTAAFWQLIVYMICLSKRADRVLCVLAIGCYIGSQVEKLKSFSVKVSYQGTTNHSTYGVPVIDYLLSFFGGGFDELLGLTRVFPAMTYTYRIAR